MKLKCLQALTLEMQYCAEPADIFSAKPAGITHLRSLNPHIASILDVRHMNNCMLSAPRSSVSHAGQAGRLAQGVSAFAFQGTNAHAVLQVPTYAPARPIVSCACVER